MDPIQPPTQQPPQALPEVIIPQPKPNYLKTIIFSVVVILLLFLSAFFYIQKQISNPDIVPVIPNPSPTPKTVSSISIPPDETAGWKIYTDIENNYKLSYPSTWKVDGTTFIPPDEGSNNEGRIIIAVNASSGSLTQFMEAINPSTGGKNSDVYILVRQINISGENGILTKGGCCGFFGQHVFFQHKDKTYRLTLQGPIDNPQAKFQLVFDQILSTFKFAEDEATDQLYGCGGIAGVICPTGYVCSLNGSYPDASGTCIKQVN